MIEGLELLVKLVDPSANPALKNDPNNFPPSDCKAVHQVQAVQLEEQRRFKIEINYQL